jgi:hypothetical protein
MVAKSSRRTERPHEVPPSFAPFVAAFAKTRDVRLEKGWGAGNVVLKVNAKIFLMSNKGELVAKLPSKRVQELVDGGNGRCFDPRRDGRLMKEWLVIENEKLPLLAIAREAYDFVKGRR